MALVTGMHLGPYEVISPLGVGGMGEVYRARDTKLNREVALKVLPDQFAVDPDRLARFMREAHTLASMNHANIGAVHGFEDAHGVHALVLELVEGPTLADRIARGPIPLDEAVTIAAQIADALDAAHASGVIHRDLKPANIKIRPDGRVKVLDFGLAKLGAREALGSGRERGADLTNSPTVIPLATLPGMVLGTPAYMAPEQARGEAVDERVDIWAFGVVLFEMLTGRVLFARQSVAETLAAVLHEEPEWSRTPARARRLLRSCLEKDPRRRLRDIGDARLLVDEAPESAPPRALISRLGWAAAGLCALLSAGLAWAPWRTPPPAAEPIRFQLAPNARLAASGASAVSPNGRHLAFIGTGSDAVPRVWVREMDSLIERPLPGTEVAGAAPPPFWSPDSRFIGFDAGGTLKKVDMSGGLAQTVCVLSSPAVGGSWSRDGVIIFGSPNGAIMRVPEAGGTPTALTTVDPSAAEGAHLTPVFLPDGRHFLYLRASRTAPERTGIFVGSLDTKPEEQDRRRILATPSSAAYAPAGGGVGTLLFLRDGNLMGQAFDEGRLELSGVPAVVAERVDSYRDTTTMSVSENGVLVYRGAASLELMWLDRQGREAGRVQERGLYQTLTLSPDGTRALVSKASSQVTSSADLWLFDFPRETSTRFTSVDAEDGAWSPDGSRVVFGAEGGMYQKEIGGSQQELVLSPSEGRKSPTSWSHDGRIVLYTVIASRTGSDIWALSMDGDRAAAPFLRSEASESQGQFSPRADRPLWIAYTSNESGRDDVFLRTFPDAGNVQMASRSGGHSPRWRGDGRELFYIATDGTVMAVPLANGPMRVGASAPLFQVPRGFASRDSTGSRAAAPWAVTPDGQRFLFAVPEDAGRLTQFTVVLNWQSGPAEAQ